MRCSSRCSYLLFRVIWYCYTVNTWVHFGSMKLVWAAVFCYIQFEDIKHIFLDIFTIYKCCALYISTICAFVTPQWSVVWHRNVVFLKITFTITITSCLTKHIMDPHLFSCCFCCNQIIQKHFTRCHRNICCTYIYEPVFKTVIQSLW